MLLMIENWSVLLAWQQLLWKFELHIHLKLHINNVQYTESNIGFRYLSCRKHFENILIGRTQTRMYLNTNEETIPYSNDRTIMYLLTFCIEIVEHLLTRLTRYDYYLHVLNTFCIIQSIHYCYERHEPLNSIEYNCKYNSSWV